VLETLEGLLEGGEQAEQQVGEGDVSERLECSLLEPRQPGAERAPGVTLRGTRGNPLVNDRRHVAAQ
jgi:hypothetical protein